MAKLGLGIIAHNEEALIERCLDSFSEVGFDEICIVVNNSTDQTYEKITTWWKRTETEENKDQTLTVSQHEITPFRFDVARNLYVDHLDQTVDFILTVDVDDLATPDLIRFLIKLKNDASPEPHSFDVASFQYRTGPNSSHLNYRLFRTKLGIKYEGAVHEYLRCPPATRRLHSKMEVIHHPTDLKHYETSAERNLNIFSERMKDEPSCREIFYYANTLRDLKRFDEAVSAYRIYRTKKPVYHDEYCHTFIYEARCLRFLSRTEEAISVLNELCAKDPSWGVAWMELCYNHFYTRQDFPLALACAARAQASPFRARLFEEENKSMGGAETIKHLKLSYAALKI